MIALAGIFLVSYNAQAQARLTPLIDTMTNAETVTVSTALLNGNFESIGFQAVVTKISGTVAGYVVLQATIDGTNWATISSDTLTLANQTTNSKIWIVSTAPYNRYRLSCTTTGTQASSIKGYYIARKPEL